MLADKLDGVVDRTTQTSYLRVAKGYLPDFLQHLVEPGDKLFPGCWMIAAFNSVRFRPVLLSIYSPISSLSPETSDPAKRLEHDKKLLDLILKIKHDSEESSAQCDGRAGSSGIC